MKRLIIGDGTLGSEIISAIGWSYISRKKDGIDFSDISTYSSSLDGYDEIINCVANTDTYSHDEKKHWEINYASVANLVDLCRVNNQKLIHISTDYVYSNSQSHASECDVPVHCANWYGYTKLLADGYIQLRSLNYLILRGSFKKYPFPYDNAIVTQIGNFDYVNEIAKLMIAVIESGATGVVNIGSDVKTIYELAKISRPNVSPSFEILHSTMPKDITINVSKMNKLINKN